LSLVFEEARLLDSYQYVLPNFALPSGYLIVVTSIPVQ